MFFELREYRTLSGERENWVNFMEEIVSPFQVSKGMVILGSFVGQEEDDLHIWVRRFEDEAEREKLYEAVYESDVWKNDIGPKIPTMMDRSKVVVRKIEASSRSVIQ